METYVIEFVTWQMPIHFHDLLPILYVYQGRKNRLLFAACARLSYHSARTLRERMQCSDDHLQRVLCTYVEYHILHGLRDGTLPTTPTHDTQWIPVNENELLALLLRSKLGNDEGKDGRTAVNPAL